MTILLELVFSYTLYILIYTVDGGNSNRFFQLFFFNNLLMYLLMCYLFILSSKQQAPSQDYIMHCCSFHELLKKKVEKTYYYYPHLRYIYIYTMYIYEKLKQPMFKMIVVFQEKFLPLGKQLSTLLLGYCSVG